MSNLIRAAQAKTGLLPKLSMRDYRPKPEMVRAALGTEQYFCPASTSPDRKDARCEPKHGK